MNPVIRNILAVIAGLVVGSIVNMGIVMISGSIIPPPDGADVTTMEGLKKALPLFQPKHFILPFLAHALGTFVGAWLASKLGVNNKMMPAIVVSVFFLCGGIFNVISLPSPAWFTVLDVVGAYLPMGWLGGKLVLRNINAAAYKKA